MFTRVKNLIVTPRREWFEISQETPDTRQLLINYMLPLVLLNALAAFIGYGLIGGNLLGQEYSGVDWGIYHAITITGGAIIGVVIGAHITDALAPTFGSEKNIGRSYQLVVYSITPGWLGGLLAIIPSIALIGMLFGLYGFYLLYTGMPILKKTPQNKVLGYLVTSVLITGVIQVVIAYFFGNVVMNALGISYSTEVSF